MDYGRYYVKARKEGFVTFYEEVQSLRGINAFNEKNQPLIQSEMKKEREKLNKKNDKK